MSYSPRYDRGDWASICDSCGRKLKASELRQRWDGLKVCQDDWEPRQPQDFVRGVADYQAPPWTRPEPSDLFIYFCDIYGSTAYAGVAVAGCSIAGNIGIGPGPAPAD